MKWPKVKCISVLAVLALFFTCSMVLAGAVPNTLNYQGTLYDATGLPVTGAKDITVSLYDVASGGTAFWKETQTGVIVKSGNFSLVLGKASGNLLDQTIQAKLSGNTYIGIKVGTDAEMVPRQQFTSVAYSLKSGDGVPIGAIIMWSGVSIPTGWSLCDGTNGTPNLRDKFIVGAGTSYSIGAFGGSATVNLQHSHLTNSHTHSGVDHLHGFSGTTSTNGNITSITHGSNQAQERDHNHTFSGITGAADRSLESGPASPGTDARLSTAQDIRPPYYALAFIMKLQ